MMVNAVKKIWVALLVGAVVLAGQAGVARAVDAPKWVAVIYVDAQRAVGLRWMPVSGATGYKVLRSETAGSGHAEIAATAQPQHFDTTAQPGTTYYYVLQATAGADVSPNSEERSVAIPGQKKKAIAPPEINRLMPQSTTEFGKVSYRVGVIWRKIPGAVAYNVYRTETPGEGYQLLTSSSENQAVDTTVEPGKTYYYAVSALDDSFQETAYSPEKSVEVKTAVKRKKRKRKVRLEIAPRPAKMLWAKQRGEEQGKFAFWEPYDLVYYEPDDLLAVVSNNTFEFYILNGTTGAMVGKAGEKGSEAGQFLDPVGMDVDEDGNVYVVDRGKASVQVFSINGGAFQREIKMPLDQTMRELPKRVLFQEVVLDPRNGDLYVLDSGNSVIWVTDEDGELLRIIGEPGFEPNQLQGILWGKFTLDGEHLMVNNAVTGRMTTLTREGEFVRSWGEKKAAVGAFTFISSFDFDVEGNVFVADKSAGFIMGFLPDGRYLYSVSGEDKKKGIPVQQPKGIAVDSKNRFWVAQGLSDVVAAYQLIGEPPPPQEKPPGEEDE